MFFFNFRIFTRIFDQLNLLKMITFWNGKEKNATNVEENNMKVLIVCKSMKPI